MINLKKLITEVKVKVAYHVAEKSVRPSIKTHGLDSNKYKGDITTSGIFIYVFIKYAEAIGYIHGYNDFLKMQDEYEKYFDIWEINCRGLDLIKDYGLNTGDLPQNDSAYAIKGPIDKKRLKLKMTIK